MKQTRGRGRKRQRWKAERKPSRDKYSMATGKGGGGQLLGRTGQFRSRKTLQGAAGWAAASSARRTAAAFITAVLALGS